MPGVPYEMEAMMEDWVLPALRTVPGRPVIVHRTIKTTGIAESHLANLLGDTSLLLDGLPGTLAYLPGPKGVRLRLSLTGARDGEVRAMIATAERRIVEKAGKHVYGFDDEDLESIVGRLLREKGVSIAIAESCTGGLIVDRLTDIPGASDIVERGFICYSNRSKVEELGVPAELLEHHGAVSAEVAEAMAEGARRVAGTNIGLSTTGIAGPTGGSTEKPVGLVFVGYADGTDRLSLRFLFGGNRRNIKERAAQAALELVRRKVTHAAG
jgi:nicotinamide-nucleotide amidase